MLFQKRFVFLLMLVGWLSSGVLAFNVRRDVDPQLVETDTFVEKDIQEVWVGICQVPPLNFIDESGQAQGLNIELLREMAKEYGWSLEYMPGSLAECLDRLQGEEIDLMLSVDHTAERESVMDYSQDPVAEVWGQVFVRPDQNVQSFDGLRGRTVGIMRRDVNGINFARMVTRLGVDCAFQKFETYDAIFEAVREGRVYAGVTPHIYGLRNADRFDLVPSDIQFSPISSYFAVKKGKNQQLLSDIDARMAEWRHDKGSYYYTQISQWLGLEPRAVSIGFRAFMIVFGVLTVVILLGVIWIHVLHRAVRHRTRELMDEKVFSDAIIDSLPGQFYVYNEQGYPVRWNESFQKATGLTEEETSSRLSFMRLCEKDRPKAMSAFKRCLEAGRSEVEVAYFDHVLQEQRSILSTGVLMDVHGLKYVVGISIDITERKEAERRAEELSYFPYQNPNPVMRICLDGGVLFANEAAERFQEECGCTDQDKICGFTRGYIKRSVDEGRPVFAERICGDKVYKLCYSAITGKGYSNVYGMDITDQKQAEAELLRLSAAINSAAESVAITDVEGTIQYVNPSFERISGYSAAEVLGRNPRILQGGEHSEEFYKNIWQTIIAGRVWHGRLKNRRKDGTIYVEEGTVSPVLDEDGNTTNYVAVKHDITGQLAVEEHFRQSQKMESVGQLAGGVAHDLNNLLTPVLGYSQILLDDLAVPEEFRMPIEQIRSAGIRARDLIHQLLVFSRRGEMKMSSLNVNEVITGFQQLVRKAVPEHIDIANCLADDLPPVLADRGQLEQVIMNLAVNARDAMPNGGRILIGSRVFNVTEAEVLGYGLAEAGQYIGLSITDNGEGMDAETVKQIFEPFFTTKEVGKGTGLGLATVFAIVSKHNGAVRVDSVLGQGTVFEVLLPVSETTPDLLREESVPVFEANGHGNIWLVEDESIVKEVTFQALTRKGYRVSAFDSPDDCLVFMATHDSPPDLLISDVVMPGMNGKELATEIRKKWDNCNILFISGYARGVISDQDLEEPGVSFLKKPFCTHDLFAEVGSFFEA